MSVQSVTNNTPSGGTPLASMVWSALANGDTGQVVELNDYPDRTFQVSGTFGTGGSISLEGSLDKTNWFALHDPQGNAITFTAAGL